MKKLIAGTLTFLLCSAAMAEYCTLTREEISGENKFCFYGCVRGEKVITIRALQRCPLLQEFAASAYEEPTQPPVLLASFENEPSHSNEHVAKFNSGCVAE